MDYLYSGGVLASANSTQKRSDAKEHKAKGHFAKFPDHNGKFASKIILFNSKLQASNKIPSWKDWLKKMIKIENLVKNYGKNRAVDDISFEIGRGEIVGFLG